MSRQLGNDAAAVSAPSSPTLQQRFWSTLSTAFPPVIQRSMSVQTPSEVNQQEYRAEADHSNEAQRKLIQFGIKASEMRRKSQSGAHYLQKIKALIVKYESSLSANQTLMKRCDAELLSVLDALAEADSFVDHAIARVAQAETSFVQSVNDADNAHKRLDKQLQVLKTAEEQEQSRLTVERKLVDRIAQQSGKMYRCEAQRSRHVKACDDETKLASLDAKLDFERQTFNSLQTQLTNLVNDGQRQHAVILVHETTHADMQATMQRLQREVQMKKRSRENTNQELHRRQLHKQSLVSLVESQQQRMSGIVKEKLRLVTSLDLLCARQQKVVSTIETIARDQRHLVIGRQRVCQTYQQQHHHQLSNATSITRRHSEPVLGDDDNISHNFVEHARYRNEDGEMIRGTLTGTSFLLMFESGSTDTYRYRFCIDLADIIECTTHSIAQNTDALNSVINLCLRDGFHNRLEFGSAVTYQWPIRICLIVSAISAARVKYHLDAWLQAHSHEFINAQQDNDNVITHNTKYDVQSSSSPSKVVIDIIGQSNVVDVIGQDSLRAVLDQIPVQHQLLPWSCLYCLCRNGMSLAQLYRLTQNSPVTLLLIRNSRDKVFGAFLSHPLRVQKSYFGSGATFVFQLDQNGSVKRYN